MAVVLIYSKPIRETKRAWAKD